MDTIYKNTVFTNVATTSDGGVFWEGLEKETPSNVQITDWRGNPWTPGKSTTPAAHPNSRYVDLIFFVKFSSIASITF